MHYQQWKQDNHNFFNDVVNINGTYGSFRALIEWQIYEPSDLKDPLRKEGIRKRFLQYKKPEWSIKTGNFYQSFGRGLVLHQTEEEDVNIDRDVDGLSMSFETHPISLFLLAGKPRNLILSSGNYSVINDTADVLEGAKIDINFIPVIPLSLNFVRFSSLDPGVEEPHQTYVYSANIEVVHGPVVLYAELAKKNGWDKTLFAKSQGTGFYGSTNVFVANISVSFEFFNYDSLGYGGTIYRYNAPPTGNLDGYSINRAKDERGWMLDISTNILEDLYLRFNTSKLATISLDSIGFDEYFGEIKGNATKQGPILVFNLKKKGYRKPEPIIDEKIELLPHFGISGLFLSHSFNIGLDSRIVDLDTISFTDNGVSIDLGILPSVTLSGRWTIRDKEVLLEGEGTEWKVIEMKWHISDKHTLNVMAGSEKGGLLCSGGVCRIEEAFEGIKMNVFSRF